MFTPRLHLSLLSARLTTVAALALAFFSFNRCADASIVVLQSSAGGVYTYDFQLGAGDQLEFDIGDRINFTGLAGVTNASVSGLDLTGLLTTCGVTATSVCFGAPSPFDLDNISGSTEDFGTLTIDSSVTTTGNVSYSLTASSVGTVSGQIGGPVVPSGTSTPEPGSLPMIAGGAALLLWGIPRWASPVLRCRQKKC